jgi:hypothetical protein
VGTARAKEEKRSEKIIVVFIANGRTFIDV